MIASVTPDSSIHQPHPIQLMDAERAADASTAFAKGFRGGRLLLPCEIHTARARQFYRRHFEQLSQWLSGLDRVRHFRDVDPRLVDEAEAAIAIRLREAHARCTEVSVQAAAQLQSGGLADIPIHYTASAAIAVPIIHPQARVCLEAVLAADGAFAAIERLWLLGHIDTRQRRARETVLRQALRCIAAEVRQQYSAMARAVRGERPQASVAEPPASRTTASANQSLIGTSTPASASEETFTQPAVSSGSSTQDGSGWRSEA